MLREFNTNVSPPSPIIQFDSPQHAMQRALDIAKLGVGYVEPNPLVGAVLIDDDLRLIAEGYHPRFSGPHAEVVALQLAGSHAKGATLFVTLEPCSHFGKTPPCADAVISAGVKRVYVATIDPAKHVAGTGIKKLEAAGIEVEVGLCEHAAKELIAPFCKLQLQKRPWVHAKWAMTLDGKLATRTGSSQWISGEKSRRVVHQLRGQMDAILIGVGTVLADNPSLTVRPVGPRTPVRIVLDRRAETPLTSKLAQTAQQLPVVIVVSLDAESTRCEALRQLGVEVLTMPTANEPRFIELEWLLDELGRRQMTNVLVEGGGKVLGDFWDQQLIDELHCFIGPKLVGGTGATSPIQGLGFESMPDGPTINSVIEVLDQDVYIHGRCLNIRKAETSDDQ